MKRTLSSSVLKKKGSRPEDEMPEATSSGAIEPNSSSEAQLVGGVKPRLGGSGSAWKAGALSDASQILQVERAQVVERILSGRHELQIDPAQIIDVIGSDRRDDWRDQEAYAKLKESIEKNGQDTPIHVWPADPNWRPDEREPENVGGQGQRCFSGDVRRDGRLDGGSVALLRLPGQTDAACRAEPHGHLPIWRLSMQR